MRIKAVALILLSISLLGNATAQQVNVDSLTEKDINTSLENDGVQFTTDYLNKTISYKNVFIPEEYQQHLADFDVTYNFDGSTEEFSIDYSFNNVGNNSKLPAYLDGYQYNADFKNNTEGNVWTVQSDIDADLANGTHLEDDADYDMTAKNGEVSVDGSLNRKYNTTQQLNDEPIQYNVSAKTFGFDTGVIKQRVSSNYEHLILGHAVRTSASPEYGALTNTTTRVFSGNETTRLPVETDVTKINSTLVQQTITNDNLYENQTEETVVVAHNPRTNISSTDFAGMSSEYIGEYQYSNIEDDLDEISTDVGRLQEPSNYTIEAWNVTFPQDSKKTLTFNYSQPQYDILTDNPENFEFKYTSYVLGSVASIGTISESNFPGNRNKLQTSSGSLTLGNEQISISNFDTSGQTQQVDLPSYLDGNVTARVTGGEGGDGGIGCGEYQGDPCADEYRAGDADAGVGGATIKIDASQYNSVTLQVGGSGNNGVGADDPNQDGDTSDAQEGGGGGGGSGGASTIEVDGTDAACAGAEEGGKGGEPTYYEAGDGQAGGGWGGPDRVGSDGNDGTVGTGGDHGEGYSCSFTSTNYGAEVNYGFHDDFDADPYGLVNNGLSGIYEESTTTAGFGGGDGYVKYPYEQGSYQSTNYDVDYQKLDNITITGLNRPGSSEVSLTIETSDDNFNTIKQSQTLSNSDLIDGTNTYQLNQIDRAASYVRYKVDMTYGSEPTIESTSVDGTEPPYASSIECTVDSTTKPCSNINSYSGTLTEIQATLEQYDPLQYVNISLADEYDDNYRILHKNYSSKSGDTVSWNVNEDLTDSGNYNITLLINETDGDTGYNQTQFSLPWGTLNPSITTPSSDISVAEDSTFTMEGNVTCVGGECSSETDGQGGGPEKIELWADPKPVDGKVKVVEHTGNVQGGDTITVDKKITPEKDNSQTDNSQTSIIEELKQIINEVLQWN